MKIILVALLACIVLGNCEAQVAKQHSDSISTIYYDTDSLNIVASLVQEGENKFFDFRIKNDKSYSIYFDTLVFADSYILKDEKSEEYYAVEVMPTGSGDPHEPPVTLSELKPGMRFFKRIKIDQRLTKPRFILVFLYFKAIDPFIQADLKAHPQYLYFNKMVLAMANEIDIANYDYKNEPPH